MSKLTRRAIMDSCARLIEERSLNKITVKDIVDDCGVTRNTFYYHFADIPSLIEIMIQEQAEIIWSKMDTIDSLEKCMNLLVENALLHKKAILHIWNSAQRNMYEKRLMEKCHQAAALYVQTLAGDRTITEETRGLMEYASACEFYGMMIDWLNHDLAEEGRERFRRLNEWKRKSVELMF